MRFRRHSLTCACLVLAAAIGWIWLGERREMPREVTRENVRKARQMAGATTRAELAAEPTRRTERPAPARGADEGLVSVALGENFTRRILSADRAMVSIPVPGGGNVEGTVTRLEYDGDEPLLVEGRITHPEPGRFHFRRQKLPGKAGPLFGFIHFDHGETAWQVRPTSAGGSELVRTTAHEIVCRSYPAPVAEIPAAHPVDDPIPPGENGIIQLQSLPGAEAVVYLDFDGEERDFEIWGEIDAAPSGATNQQIFEVWQGVCEDFQPFNINITTIRSVYEAAASNQRMQVIVTPTTQASPGAGGVAIIGSFNTDGDVVCWSFSTTGKNAIEVISHEVGHTLGLSHDGRNNPVEEYYAGHFDWAPVMGVGYTRAVTQWSKGEYMNANNPQDDLLVISNNNGVDYRADDYGSTAANAGWLDLNMSGDAFAEGIIETRDDRDSFRFSTTGGNLSLQIQPAPPAGGVAVANLDIKAELLRVTSSLTSIVSTSDSGSTTSAALNVTGLTAGDYLVRVSGVGRASLVTGYSDYGSLGSYTITGTVGGGVHQERFFLAENTANATVIGNVPPRADHSTGVLGYEISQDNSGGAFAIHPSTGVITVADSALLDYESLSSRWDDPATLDFTVTITDNLEYAMETIRVVVQLMDVNEPPVFEATSTVFIPASVLPGTPVTSVRANDPDRADFVAYSIVAGNEAGVFSIDPDTGLITVSGTPDYQTVPVHYCVIRATDQAAPPNESLMPLAIQLLPVPEGVTAGSVVRTFYNEIPGSDIADLTGSQRFPEKPNSQSVLSSFETGTGADYQYGSVVSGYLIAPATGSYTFWISAGESGQLLLSTDQNPSNAVAIAAVTGSTEPGEWNAEPGQQSAPVVLQAGGVYYIEARQKQGFGTDHVQAAWQGPGMAAKEIIPGLWLAPRPRQFAPWADSAALTVRDGTAPGVAVGALSFTEANLGQQIANYAITAGNEDGYFTIDESSGTIRVASGAAFTAGETYQLTVSATDDGSPAASGVAFANVTVRRLDEDMHAWWRLDESSGTIASDSSGNGRTAWFNGTPVRFARDAADNALQLDGIGAGFSRYDYDSPSGATPFTVAAWVKIPANHSSEAVLIQQADTSFMSMPGYYRVSVTAAGNVRFAVYGNDEPFTGVGYQFDLVTTAAINDGQWHHVACVRDGQTGRIVIDGGQQAVGSGTPRMLHPESDISVGYDSKLAAQYLAGAVDDVRIYREALNGPQLTRIAAAPKIAITGPAASQVVIPPNVGLWLNAAASAPVGSVTGITWSSASGPGAVVFDSPASASTGATFAATGTYVLRATATNGTDDFSSEISVSAGCTAVTPFAGTLIGPAGSGFHLNNGPGSYQLAGDTPGILPAGTQDGFYLLGQVFSGDFDVRTRVNGAYDDEFGEPFGIAGLVVREGSANAPDDAGGFIGLRPAASSATWMRRATTGAANVSTDYPGIGTPHWCRVTRTGDSVGFWDSPDGVAWTSRGTMTFAGNVTVGMCWSSNATGFPGNASFSGLAGLSTGNVGPAVDAGPDFAAETTMTTGLAGSVDDDNLPAPPAAVTMLWSLVSGPGTVDIEDPADPLSQVIFDAPGTYVLRLTANDGAVATFDDVTVTVTDPLPVLNVVATTPGAAETGPVTGVLTITRDVWLVGDLTVNFTLTGTAGNIADYEELASSVVIPDGLASVEIDIVPIADGLPEGPETVVLTITAGDYIISGAEATVNIADSNHAPEWDAPVFATANATEDMLYSGTLVGTATDPDAGDSLTFAKESGPAWLEIATDGTLSGTPLNADVGLNEFTVRVTDGDGLFDEATLQITVVNVNDEPEFTVDPFVGTDATEDVLYSGILAGTANDPDVGDSLVFTKQSGPAWLEVATDGTLSGTPLNADVGLNNFTVRVTDGDELFDEATLQITVVNVNDEPEFTINPITGNDATENVLYSGTLAGSATDPDAGDTRTFTKESGPAWLEVAADGTLGGTPASGDVGPNEFIVRVTDGGNLFDETTLQITVGINDAPVFTVDPIAGNDATQDATYSGALAGSATDPDAGDTRTFTKESGPAWLEVATDGTLGGTPANGDVGPNEFTVRVTDGGNLFDEATLQITVINVNDEPEFTTDPIVGTNATEDVIYSGTLAGSATDPDVGDSLTFTKQSGPAWLEVASDGTLSGTPLNSHVGLNEFIVRVTDGDELFDESALQITVTNTNDEPEFTADPIVGGEATENIPYSGTLAGAAADPDVGDSLTFTKLSGPAWLEIATDGTLGGTPVNGDVGLNNFTVRVTDGDELFDEATLQITVGINDAPEFTVDPIAGADATEDVIYSGTLAGTATDPDVGDSLTFTKQSGPAWLEVASDGTLSGTPLNADVGLNNFIVRVTDGDELFDEATLQITVVNVNDEPEFTVDPIAGTDATEDVLYSGTLAGTATDPDVGDSLTFTKESGPAWLEIATDGTLTGTPLNTDVGPNEFIVRVTDGDELFDEATLKIQVAFANQPPAFDAEIPAPPAAVAQIPYIGFTLADFADDPNLPQGDEIVFSKLSGPAWLEVAPDGTISGTPGIADIGPNQLVVRVTDLADESDDTTLEIIVGPTILYLDTNGQTAGSGVAGAITWDNTAIWSAEADGVTATHAWVPGATAVLAAGNDATAAVITVDGTRSLGTLVIEEGEHVLTGGALSLSETDAVFDINAATTIESPVTGTNLGKTGPGTLTLAGPDHALTGQLDIMEGTVKLTGMFAAAGGVAAEAGATFGGDGTITGAVAVSGTLSPGADLGTLTTGTLTMNDGSSLAWRIDSWTGVAGTDHDLVAAASLVLSGTVTIDVDAAAMVDFTDTAAEFTLVSTTGGITGFETTDFTIDTASLPQATGHWNVVPDGNDLKLTYTPLTPFELWQIAEFVEKSTDPQIAGETMDPDGDGLANLIEYALGTDPELPGPTTITQDFVEIEGDSFLRLTVPLNPGATDITVVVETTSDLSVPGSWTTLDSVVETDLPTLLVVRDTLGGPRRFMRLGVTR